MSRPEQPTRKLPMRELCTRYAVTDRTIDRWLETGILPKPMRINRVRYWDLAEIEAMEKARAASDQVAATPTPSRGRAA